jgi:hypothetical protein
VRERGHELDGAVAAAVFSLFALLLSSCALPLPLSEDGGELIAGYAAKNDAAKWRRRVVPGLDLRWGPWGGITLGWSDTRSLSPCVPQPSRGADFPRAGGRGLAYAAPLGIAWRDGDGTERRLGLVFFGRDPAGPACRFLHHTSGGVDLSLGAHRQGLTLGLSSASVVAIAAGTNGVFELTYSSRNLGLSRLVRREGGTSSYAR